MYQTSTRRVTYRQRWLSILFCLVLLMTAWPAQFGAAYEAPSATLANLVCFDAIEDAAIDRSPSSSPWRPLRNEVSFTMASARVFSPPQAIFLVEDDDGDGDGGIDVDAFGQQFSIPPTTEQIIGSLRYRIAPDALGSNDRVTISLHLPDDPTLAGRVFAVDIPLSGRADGNWRSFTWAATSVTALIDQGAARLQITMRGVNDGTALALSFDDIEAQVCTRTLATLGGRVSQHNRDEADLSDVQVLLVRSDTNGQTVVATAGVTPADDGFRYQFDVLPLADGERYQVWFVNQPLRGSRDQRRLALLAGPVVTELVAGEEILDLDLELSSPRLLDPPPGARLVLRDDSPVRLLIEPRGIEDELYQICLYDPAVIIPETGLPPQLCSPLLTADEPYIDLVPSSFATFPLRYDHPYRWYAIVHDNRGTEQLPAYGYSFAERTITFLLEPPSLPVRPVNDEGLPDGLPPASWTVLIYVAADNALGDPLRTSAVARPDFELERLRSLAMTYPNLSLVTFYDGYGITGGQMCALRGSAVDCRSRLEPNSADPATLREFVTFGLTEFPATRTMLVLIGPAHPAFGFASDESVANIPAMTIADLGTALTNATTAAAKRIDLILMQAPLTANLNTALALAPAADYLIAPPGQIWRTAWLNRVLNRLNTANNAPRAVAIDLPALYGNAVRADGVLREYAMTTLDLTRADEVQAARNALAVELTRMLNERTAVMQLLLMDVRNSSTAYDSSGNGLINAMRDSLGEHFPAPEDAFIDLGDFTTALAAAPALQAADLAAARTATLNLRNALGGSTPLVIATHRLANGQVGLPELPIGAGLAELFPHRALLGTQPLLVEYLLYRGQNDNWSAFVRQYLATDRPLGIGGVTGVPTGGTPFPLITGLPLAYDRYLPIVAR
ncbi:clostripain-related cysteine peptidase [Chloroflexus sp.]|uniref:clostripain-related cysteine peptidase n=1 Tax=Chloroflexus sp. TaxID=1904827 RepID=UPI004049BA65